MKYVKSYAIPPTDELPIIVGRTEGLEPRSDMLHNHPGIEINLILRGLPHYLIGGREYACHQGDIVLIGEGEVHRALGCEGAVFLVVIFPREFLVSDQAPSFEQKFLAPFWASGLDSGPIVSPSTPGYGLLEADLLAVEMEARERGNSYRLAVKSRLLSFAAGLTRILGIEDDSPLIRRGQKSRRFATLKDYVEERYPDKILVSDMALQVNMSVSHFTRSFKEAFGMTPIDYLIQVRVRHSAEMLLSEERKVIDVANDCGFASLSHFIECFRRITGVAPHVYRSQQ